MKIIVTPAKKVKKEVDYFSAEGQPVFLQETQKILTALRKLDVSQLQKVLKCSLPIAQNTYNSYHHTDLYTHQVPALFAYQGIQFDHLAADIFSDEEYHYIKKHIVILSGFYGILRPFDGIVPYRLELNDPLKIDSHKNLYQFWGRKIYDQLILDDHCLLDLGAKQYSRMIQKYLDDHIQYVQCRFKEQIEGKLVERGVYVKIARGEMIRYLISHHITDFEGVKSFSLLGYHFAADLSSRHEYIFVRNR